LIFSSKLKTTVITYTNKLPFALKVENISNVLSYAEQAHSLDSSSNKLLVNLAEVLVISGNKPRALEKLALLPATTTEYKYKVEELMKQL
jgi:thioredoxin-like negative regulator of GroEL